MSLGRQHTLVRCAMTSLFVLFVAMAASGIAESAETPLAAQSLSLADIAAMLEAVDKGEWDVRQRLPEGERYEEHGFEVDAAENTLLRAGRVDTSAPADLVEYFEAADLEITIRNILNQLAVTIGAIAARARQLDEDLDRLASDSAKSIAWLATARRREAPAALLATIETIPTRSDELARQIKSQRDRLLQILDRAQRLRREAETTRAEVSERRAAIATHLRTASDVPIWRISATPGEIDRSFQVARTRAERMLDYVRQHAPIVLGIAVVAFGLCYAVMFATRRQLAHDDETDPFGRRAKRLFDAPIAAALLMSLLALLWFGPVGPIAYYDVLASLLPIPAVMLARVMFGERLRATLYTLAAVLISLTWLGPVVEPLPLASRLLLIAQCIAVAAAIGWDLRRENLASTFPAVSPAVVRWAGIATIALLVIAVALSIVGAIGAARLLRNLGLVSLGLALILSVAMHLLYGLIVALTETGAGRKLRIFRGGAQAAHRFVRRALITLASAVWVVAMAQALGLLDSVLRLGDRIVTAEIRLGAAHVELRGIFVGLAVLVATYLVVRIVRFVLEVELLPRVRLKQGIAFAISAVVRYVLLTRRRAACGGRNGYRLDQSDPAGGCARRGNRPWIAGRREQFRVRLDPARRAPHQCGRQRTDRRRPRRRARDRRALDHHIHGPGRGSHRTERRAHLEIGDQLDANRPQAEGRDRRERCARRGSRIGHAGAGGHRVHDRRRRRRSGAARVAHGIPGQFARLSTARLGRRHRPCACRAKRASHRDRAQVPGCHDAGGVVQALAGNYERSRS